VKCVVLQPSYVPWRGYFHQIHLADVFVFYDDVQYDARGWRNRNRVKTPQGTRWLSIPVIRKRHQLDRTPIHEIRINWDRPWNRKHLATLRHLYGGTPHYEKYFALLAEFYARHDVFLADFTIDFTVAIAAELGLKNKRFVRSSSLGASGRKTERLLQILKAVGADEYVTGPSASAYLDERLLRQHGISIAYMDYRYPEYEQRYPPYDPHVTILDLLFMTGPKAAQYIWGINEPRELVPSPDAACPGEGDKSRK